MEESTEDGDFHENVSSNEPMEWHHPSRRRQPNSESYITSVRQIQPQPHQRQGNGPQGFDGRSHTIPYSKVAMTNSAVEIPSRAEVPSREERAFDYKMKKRLDQNGPQDAPGWPQTTSYSQGAMAITDELEAAVLVREQQFGQFTDQRMKPRMGQRMDQEDAPREAHRKKVHTAPFSSLKETRHVMPNHRSYHKEINGKEAEQRLVKHSERNCYLTRYSKNSEAYVLSAIISYTGHEGPVHLKLKMDSEEHSYSLEGTGKIFRTLDELLSYYEKNPLSSEIRNIGSPCPSPEALQQQQPQEQQQQEQHRVSPRQQEPNENNDRWNDMQEMQKALLEALNKQQETLAKQQDALAKQQEVYQKQSNEQRERFEEQLKREKEEHKGQMQAERLQHNTQMVQQKKRCSLQ